jgi:hypothetical protein
MKVLDILGCHSLEAHLSGAIVAQQGPKDQPARASIWAVARNEDRRIYVTSKYLS